MDIGSYKSAYNRINIVKMKNNFRIIVKIIEMGYFLIMSSKNFERKTLIIVKVTMEYEMQFISVQLYLRAVV